MASGKKQIQQLAKQFFKLSVVDGNLSSDRVAGVMQYVEKHRPDSPIAVLRAYQRLDIEAIAGLRQPPDVEAEVEQALRWFIRNVLERDPRSLAFLDEVRSHRQPVGVMTPLAQREGLPSG